MRKQFFKLAFTLLTIATYAQENFKDATIITLRNDTLKGRIDDRLWSVNPSEIEFRDATGSVVKYDPEDVKGFSISSRVYRSFQVRYDSSSKKEDQLPTSSSPAYKTESLFLKVLLISRYSLLEFLDAGDRFHYFIQDGDKVVELVYHIFRMPSTMQLMENKYYIGQLTSYFADCKTMKVPATLPYSKSPIMRLVAEYAECKGDRSTTLKSVKSESGLRSQKSFGITSNVALDKYQSSFTAGMGYGFGLFYSLSPANNFQKLTFRFEVTTHKFPENTSYYKVGANTYYQTVNITSMKASIMMRARFEESKHQSFYTLGVSSLISNNIKTEGNYLFGTSEEGTRLAFLTGLGTNFGNFSPEMRCEVGTSGYLSLQFILSYAILRSH